MIRELLQNEQFLADNTGQPIQRPAPQREPEPMDVASIIAPVLGWTAKQKKDSINAYFDIAEREIESLEEALASA